MFEDLTSFQKYMWISFFVFLLPFTIIVTAKFVQYFRRWGEVKVSGLEYIDKFLHLSLEKKSLTITSTLVRSPTSQNLKKILLIPPFSVSVKRYLYLATAFALNNYEVHLIENRKNLVKIRKEQLDGTLFFSEVVNQINPQVIIASDILFSLLLPSMQQDRKIRFAFIRPIISNKQRSLFPSLILSIPWITNIFQLLRTQDDLTKFGISNRVLCVFPKIFLRERWTNKNSGNLDIQLVQSRFSFRDKETMVFSRILQFIGESSS
jgi:hypothetical protein